MKNLKDEQLVVKFLEGDDDSFEELLKRHLKPIYNFIFRLTENTTSTDDLVQDVFIKVWKSLHRFDQNKNFKVWIFSIARNTTYDFFKKKKAIPFSYFEDREENNQFNNIPDDNLSPDKMFDEVNLSKDFAQKLEKIPLKYRTILLLYYRDGFSLSEIAEILGKPYNTVKSQHGRALRGLKKLFMRPN